MKLFRQNDLLMTKEINGAVCLHMQRSDNRGVRLYNQIKNGRIASNVARLWAAINWHYRPQICADVGANYGEVSLTTRYETGQTLYVFEANPYIVRPLERSIRSHRNRAQIQLIPSFVGSEEGEIAFHIDLKWSGTSSAFFQRGDGSYKGMGDQGYEKRYIPQTTLSACIPDREKSRLLLKIDVEGAELDVLQGAEELLSSLSSYFIIMEFNRTVIRLKGDDEEEWLQTASRLGRVYVIRKNKVTPIREKALRGAGKADLLIAKFNDDALAKIALRVSRAGPL